ncbi:hypothetical protein COLSTE_00043 [Collinsella stercoris DSM 13279]|uniref:Uncharacterized protein n=1 Tax=Collinsella stercoris DSM 13279 TaxID=445975 RepID=B6G7K5_9ACTN|nr:hypothetical protein COLSTE_00043 [Collinsella stercoris DSM 13279]
MQGEAGPIAFRFMEAEAPMVEACLNIRKGGEYLFSLRWDPMQCKRCWTAKEFMHFEPPLI